MRKQYNFWPSEVGGGFDAWDVDRLIALAADLAIRDVALDAIAEVDSNYWFNHGDPPTVRVIAEHARLIAEADTSYPILLTHDGRVLDGMHRIGRALLDGASTIRAVKFPTKIEPDHRNCWPADLPYDSR